MRSVEVAIIGAGTAGLTARREVAKKTQNYVVIDDGVLGTTCARVGCMPSKVLIQIAEDFHRRHSFSESGLKIEGGMSVDSVQVMNRVRSLRDRFVRSVLSGMQEWGAEHFIRKRARFVEENILDLGDEKLKADKIIIATGSKPWIPSEWSSYQSHLVNTDQFFEWESLPQSMAVVGLGVIGLELGQALSRLGVKLTAFSRNPRLGGLSDPDLQKYTLDCMKKEFDIKMGPCRPVALENDKIIIESFNEKTAVEKVLLSIGRKPQLSDLSLESAGVELNEKDLPEMIPGTSQINGKAIYIAGDCTGDRMILHEAADEGRIAGYNAVQEKAPTCFQKRCFLGITFSDPNICIVGATFQSLKESRRDFVVGKVSFEGQGRAIIMNKEKGLLHVYVCKESAQILGAEFIAPKGEHLAHLLSWAVQLKKNVFELLSMPFYHPVLEEGLRTALRNAARQVSVRGGPLEAFRCDDFDADYCEEI